MSNINKSIARTGKCERERSTMTIYLLNSLTSSVKITINIDIILVKKQAVYKVIVVIEDLSSFSFSLYRVKIVPARNAKK
jgi:hypothetical protein